MVDSHTKLICVFYMLTNYTCMSILCEKYRGVGFATGDTHTHMLYTGALDMPVEEYNFVTMLSVGQPTNG